MAGIEKLALPAQNYAWGKVGLDSKVAQLLPADSVSDTERYAELWMGTHVNGPARVKLSNGDIPLVSEHIGHELPYLFKVLSVDRALSIQAHPHKELAAKLHAERPTVYKDPNHKPEMAVALTEFEAMCGFRPPQEIARFLENVQEFRNVVGDEAATLFTQAATSGDGLAEALQKVFTAVMTADAGFVQEQVAAMITRLANEPILEEKSDRSLDMNELVPRLNGQFPGDVGIFAAFMLNCLKLQIGEAIFLEANLPHAYLSGNCLETMACSDNVVRAGLTPKLRDTPVLCSMLKYEPQLPTVMSGTPVTESTREYAPPVAEFRLHRSTVAPNAQEVTPTSQSNDFGIALVFEGQGTVNGMPVSKGDCLLLPPDLPQIEIVAGEAGCEIARCFAPQ